MRALIVDLNNFSRYPTMSVGIMSSVLRSAGIRVEVLSPLAVGVDGYPRPMRASPWGLVENAARFWTATTPSPVVRRVRAEVVRSLRPTSSRNHAPILRDLETRIENGVDVVLISTYTMYFELCCKIGRVCADRGIPVVIGGNYFSQTEIVEHWLRVPGVAVVYRGEPESNLVDLVDRLARGEDASGIPGAATPAGRSVAPAPSIDDLDAIPFPDYTDFPWDRYPNRIIPMMTGRGCGWGVCRFCGDVATSAARRFRSRSPGNVIAELAHQHKRHDTTFFTFLDLKLNSELSVWRTLAESARRVVPEMQWTASLHVAANGQDGLDAAELRAASEGGLVRITTGLESGSRRVLDSMAKGADPDRTSEVLHAAHAAGISIRLTTIAGYPGEEPDDVAATARFLERHAHLVDRVVVNRFAVMLGAGIQRDIEKHPDRYPHIRDRALDLDTATVRHHNQVFSGRAYRVALWRLLRAAHGINRKPLTQVTRGFEGVI